MTLQSKIQKALNEAIDPDDYFWNGDRQKVIDRLRREIRTYTSRKALGDVIRSHQPKEYKKIEDTVEKYVMEFFEKKGVPKEMSGGYDIAETSLASFITAWTEVLIENMFEAALKNFSSISKGEEEFLVDDLNQIFDSE